MIARKRWKKKIKRGKQVMQPGFWILRRELRQEDRLKGKLIERLRQSLYDRFGRREVDIIFLVQTGCNPEQS